MDASGNLLRRLCCHVTGIDDQRVERYFLLAVNLLNESWNGPPVKDHTSAGDKIKRRLVREKRMEDATRFSCLLNKLVRSDVLHNKGSILMLFFALNNNKLYTARSKIRTSNAGLTNSHKEDTFPLPKLLLPERQKSVSSSADNADQNSKHNSLEKREGSNRVWNLAERYKAAATAQPNSPFAELQQLHKTSSRSMADKLPLSSSVNKHPSKLGASEEITEKELIREVLFIFQGVDGKIIKLDCSKDGYTIDPKIRLSQTQNEVLMKLVGVGWLYKRVNSFCEHGGSIQGSERTADRMVSGLVHQALVTVLKEHLIEYRRLIAVLDTQIQEGGDTPLGEVSEGLTLIKLFMWIWEPRCRLKTLALLADSARQEHGGSCISNLYQYLRHGDPGRRKVVSHILSHSSQPIYVMLTQWLLEGTLQDPHLEFFIVADPLVPDDRLWHDKYSIRWTMLPSFISKSQAQQILASGKSLNFLRNVCQCQGPISGRDVIKRALQQTSVDSLFTQVENEQLNSLVSLAFRETSRHVLEEILTQHKFMKHLTALSRYLLLGQGDFIHYLMEILSPSLAMSASSLFPHNISTLLETAIVASNAQYEEPDILKRLDVRLLEISAGDIGWDIFTLDYHVDGPIGTVFTADCMRQYLMLFNALWKDKRMTMILSNIWKEQAATSKLCRDLPELTVVLHGIQLLTTEMIHLVHQMQYYMTFEVMECSWHGLMTNLKSAQSLDDVIAAHNEYLKRIVSGAFLDAESKHLRIHLRTFYNVIENLQCLQELLSSAVLAEVNARKVYEADAKARTASGNFGTSAEQQEAEKKRRREFTTKVVTKFISDLRIITQTYQNRMQSFLLMLTQHDDWNLHLLSTRLDFNLYYHKRDHRLSQQLTYHHKRKSMGTSFTQ